MLFAVPWRRKTGAASTSSAPLAIRSLSRASASKALTPSLPSLPLAPCLLSSSTGRSTDYPFGFLQVKLDDKGQGNGQIMAAGRIRFDRKKGNYEIESYGNQYIKATNVRPSN